MGIHIGCSPLIMSGAHSYEVIGNTLTLLFQGRVRDCGVTKDGLVVALNECRASAGYPYHVEFIPQPAKILTALLHCNKFEPKATRFYTGLLLG